MERRTVDIDAMLAREPFSEENEVEELGRFDIEQLSF
jgi:hypothetical protein